MGWMTNKEKEDRVYRKIEAMFWKGYDSEYIAAAMQMDRIKVLDTMQLIYGRRQMSMGN